MEGHLHSTQLMDDVKTTRQMETCAQSRMGQKKRWLVDLEAIQSISRIVIYHKTGGGSFGKSITITLVKSIGILRKGTF